MRLLAPTNPRRAKTGRLGFRLNCRYNACNSGVDCEACGLHMNSPLSRLIGALQRWAWLLILGLLLGAGAAFAANRLTPSVYLASTTLLINEATSGDGAANLSSFRVKARGQIAPRH